MIFCIARSLKSRHIGKDLRRIGIQHFGFRNHIEKLGNGAIHMEIYIGPRHGRNKYQESIAYDKLEWFDFTGVFIVQETHFQEFHDSKQHSNTKRYDKDILHGYQTQTIYYF